jgi:hydrogenase maturation factor
VACQLYRRVGFVRPTPFRTKIRTGTSAAEDVLPGGFGYPAVVRDSRRRGMAKKPVFNEQAQRDLDLVCAAAAAHQWVLGHVVGAAYVGRPIELARLEAFCLAIDDITRQEFVARCIAMPARSEAIHEKALQEIEGIFGVARKASGLGPRQPQQDPPSATSTGDGAGGS